MILEHFPSYSPHDFVFKIAKTPEDLDALFAVRRAIFCEEQSICNGGGRIDERKPGIWHGSRLGVAMDYRRIRHFSPGVAIRNLQPCYYYQAAARVA